MKLLYSRNPNPRLAVAVARQVRAPVTFEFAAPLAPGQADATAASTPHCACRSWSWPMAAACGKPMQSPACCRAQPARHSGGRAKPSRR